MTDSLAHGPHTCNADILVGTIRAMLLRRAGLEITAELADERARNIATVLLDDARQLVQHRNEAVAAARRWRERCIAAETLVGLETQRADDYLDAIVSGLCEDCDGCYGEAEPECGVRRG